MKTLQVILQSEISEKFAKQIIDNGLQLDITKPILKIGNYNLKIGWARIGCYGVDINKNKGVK